MGAHTHVCIHVRAYIQLIVPQVNLIAWLKFELTFYDVTVQLFSFSATNIPPYSTLGKLFVLDKNTSNHIAVY